MKKFKLLAAALLAAGLLLNGCGAKTEALPEVNAQKMEAEKTEETAEAVKEAAVEKPEADAVTEEVSEEPEFHDAEKAEELYAPMIEKIRDMAQNGLTGPHFDDEQPGESGIREVIRFNDDTAALEILGYCVEDISGDGIPELVIGVIDDNSGYGSEILAVYTVYREEVHNALEGWARNSYTLIGPGEFYYHGSAGAYSSMFGHFIISQDGLGLNCRDYYFTDMSAADAQLVFYHNTHGYYDPESSQKMDVTEEEFYTIEDELLAAKQPMELTPFGVKSSLADVDAFWAQDEIMGYADYETFVADESDMVSRILFTTNTEVKDFTFLSLELADVDEEGNITFNTTDLYHMDALTPECPLVVEQTFYGDIPSYGVRYTDTDGVTRSYSVEISGQTGLIMLNEF